MDPRYRDIFREQLILYEVSQAFVGSPANYPVNELLIRRPYPWPFVGRSLAMVGEAIESAGARTRGSYELRPDARLFLHLNLHQLVALPLLHPDAPSKPPEGLPEQLADDCRRILGASRDFAEPTNSLSAASILKGTAKVVDELHIRSWRLWDRDDSQ